MSDMKYSPTVFNVNSNVGKKRSNTNATPTKGKRLNYGVNRRNPFYKQISYGIHSFKRTISWTDEVYLSFNTPSTTGGELVKINEGIKFIIDRNSTLSPGIFNYASGAIGFSLSSLINVSEFSTLFDAYRIRKVVIKLQTYGNVSSNPPGIATQTYPNVNPMIHYVIDHDDATIPTADATGIDDLRQYSSYRCVRLVNTENRPLTIIVKPRILTATVNASGTGLSRANLTRNTWIDIANTSTPHYGLRFVIQALNPQQSQIFNTPMRAETTYYFQCKGVR